MSNNKVHGHCSTSTTKYGYSSTQAYDPSIPTTKTKGDEYYVHKPRVVYYSEEQNDDTFNEYIQRAGQKIRTGASKIIDPEFISNTSSSPTTTTDEQDVANTNYYYFDNKEKENDQQFSDFIQIAKKKLRTTSRVGRNNNNGSFKRG
ncbi:hypothetical protein AHAS_Ahas06G0102800 [Arachis hypogaea]